MRAAGPAVVLLVVVASIPTVPAQDPVDLCIITFRPSDDFSSVLVRVDLVLNETEREALSRRVDADGSGFVSPTEVAAYRRETRTYHEDFRQLGHKKLARNQDEPTNVTFWNDLTNAIGPASAYRNWLVTEVREYRFPPSTRTQHVIEGGNDTRVAYVAIEFAVILAPDGWWVTGVNQTEHAASRVEVSGFDTFNRYWIEFTRAAEDPPPTSKPASGPGAALLFLGLAALGTLGRRRD